MHDTTHDLRAAAKALAAGTLPRLDHAAVAAVEDLTPLINAAAIELDLGADLDAAQTEAFEEFSALIDRVRLRRAILANMADTTLARQFRAAVTREARCETLAAMLDEAFAILREAGLDLCLTTEWEDGFGEDWDIRTVHVAVLSRRVADAA